MALRLRLATTSTAHNWLTLAGRPTVIVAVSKSNARTDAAHLPDAVAGIQLELSAEEVALLEAPYRPRPVAGHE